MNYKYIEPVSIAVGGTLGSLTGFYKDKKDKTRYNPAKGVVGAILGASVGELAGAGLFSQLQGAKVLEDVQKVPDELQYYAKRFKEKKSIHHVPFDKSDFAYDFNRRSDIDELARGINEKVKYQAKWGWRDSDNLRKYIKDPEQYKKIYFKEMDRYYDNYKEYMKDYLHLDFDTFYNKYYGRSYNYRNPFDDFYNFWGQNFGGNRNRSRNNYSTESLDELQRQAGFTRQTTKAGMKAEFRRRAQELHPDKHPGQEAHYNEEFKKFKTIYDKIIEHPDFEKLAYLKRKFF